MSSLPSYFKDFLQEIRPTQNMRNDFKAGHKRLRERLMADENLKQIIVRTFLQGSYKRSTAIRPKSGKRSDVDLVVVTNLHEDQYPNPEDAMRLFVPMLERHYAGKYELQGRSIGIELHDVDFDLVITSSPTEAQKKLLESEEVNSDEGIEAVEEDQTSSPRSLRRIGPLMSYAQRSDNTDTKAMDDPLRIPDRLAKEWDDTHPLAQIQWATDKNAATNCHYINVVKAIKWWRRVCYPDQKYPKGYPVEHLIGLHCPDGIISVAEGVTRALESMATDLTLLYYASIKQTPYIKDHGVQHNVFGRLSGEDFAAFHSQVVTAAVIARTALDAETVCESAHKWRQLFGNKFPLPPDDGAGNDRGDLSPSNGGFKQPSAPAIPDNRRFA
jgi:predicted nucleotidyltransferase